MTSLATTTPAPVIRVTGLIKRFGRFSALRGVTADFEAGRMYAILGDNGAGKTTLLRSLAGLSEPSHGSVIILGAENIRSVCHQIGYMAHPSLLYEELSAIENLRYFAQLYGVQDEARCASVIALVGLDAALAKPVGQYSQGMRQRLSLARALINNPRLLFLDEPFSNVDIRSAQTMVELLKHLREEGRTLLIVTHQAVLLNGVADEFVNMDSGLIVSRTPELGEHSQHD